MRSIWFNQIKTNDTGWEQWNDVRFFWCSALISISLFSAAKSETDPMNAYLSQNRPLVVLMPDAQDDLLVSQSDAFDGRAADLTDRAMVIIEGI